MQLKERHFLDGSCRYYFLNKLFHSRYNLNKNDDIHIYIYYLFHIDQYISSFLGLKFHMELDKLHYQYIYKHLNHHNNNNVYMRDNNYYHSQNRLIFYNRIYIQYNYDFLNFHLHNKMNIIHSISYILG